MVLPLRESMHYQGERVSSSCRDDAVRVLAVRRRAEFACSLVSNANANANAQTGSLPEFLVFAMSLRFCECVRNEVGRSPRSPGCPFQKTKYCMKLNARSANGHPRKLILVSLLVHDCGTFRLELTPCTCLTYTTA